MATVLPGTVIEVSKIEKGVSRTFKDGLFAAGGITLSQVSSLTGLEPYLIQNWVKRGFVAPPQKRMYSCNRFARICIINMLRETLRIDKIIELLTFINGIPNDESDDLLDDAEIYHRYVDMLSLLDKNTVDDQTIRRAAAEISADLKGNKPEAARRLEKVLAVFAYAHFASVAKQKAELLIIGLE